MLVMEDMCREQVRHARAVDSKDAKFCVYSLVVVLIRKTAA